MAFTVPTIDPVLLSLGFVSVKWYGLAYAVGLFLGYLYIKKIIRLYEVNFETVHIDNFFTWAVLAIVLGGRLAYVIFYDPARYLEHPLEIIKIYEGGMSFHGGMFLVCTAIYLFCKKHSLEWKTLSDLLSISAPIVIFLGRAANFINQELWGRKTNMPWGIIFPYVDSQPRHPSQIYEALLEGVLLFLFIRWSIDKYKTLKYKGLTSGLFYVGYGCTRIFSEFFREPDIQIGFLIQYCTMGQILSLPILMAGSILIWQSLQSKKNRDLSQF